MIQLQVLNRIIEKQDPSFFILNNLNVDFFSDYPEEFKYIKDHYDQYGNIPDPETFLNKFPNFDYIQVHESDKYLLDSLFEDKNRRQLAKVFNNVRTKLMDNDVDGALKLFTTAAEEMGEAVHLDSVDILKDFTRYDEYVDRIGNFDKYYVTTGFFELDEVLGGWDRKNEYATIVARSNQGKSWLLLKTAIAAAEAGLNVGLYSGEMTVSKVGYRADTLIGHLSNTAITKGQDFIMNDYKRYIESLKQGRVPGSIKVLTPEMISGPAGITALRAFIKKEKLDMLCIDQHSLLEDDRRAKNPVEKASNISRDIKNLQVMEQIPIITVSQQNRESTEETGITLAHIAQSDRIGQDSTVVLSFEQKDGVLNLQIIKARDAAVGKKLQYAINFDKGTFEYMPANTDAKGGDGCENLHVAYDAGQEAFHN